MKIYDAFSFPKTWTHLGQIFLLVRCAVMKVTSKVYQKLSTVMLL